MADPTGKDDWALCVGIGHYLPGTLGPLPGACRDAIDFFAWVSAEDGGGVPETQRKLLLSPVEQVERTPSPLAHMLEAWLKSVWQIGRENERNGRPLRIGRRLYLYFSGHGLALGEAGETALLTADAAPPDSCEHFAGRLWAEWFRLAAAFDEVVLVLDCCRSENRQVHVNGPPWERRKAQRPARHLYAHAVADGAAARETVIDGVPGGVFTRELLHQLRTAPRPLTAWALRAALYLRLRDGHTPVVQVPDNPDEDFEILGGSGVGAGRLENLARPDHRGTASLEVTAHDPLARLLVWTAAGELVAEGTGSIRADSLSYGEYLVRGTIGTMSVELTHRLDGDAIVRVPPVPIDTPFPLAESPEWTDDERAELRAVPPAPLVVVHRGLPDGWPERPREAVAARLLELHAQQAARPVTAPGADTPTPR